MSIQIPKNFNIFNIMVLEIENVLNKSFANVCKWFVDNKLSIHFCAAFLIQIFLCRPKISDTNGDMFRSRRQMCKSFQQISFSLIAHYQLTSL